ncbi:cold-shock protein [Pragia fontium]|uniref:Cold shock protein (Beta-ribbon, CspA family) n=2 Tax=Pragia fontium TaxID=82985 RepID=A0AAJ4WB74_9GAMM|nr:cold shock domain-containing protein [Pragia fontium]AKJ42247.1 cold-shock protein [Pragia fontium]SFC96011.1 cold shock protein (beta-ribbon, CspA family) [Pragia fontium DSM 5563 = ATCC 49100]SUB82516.1 Cold shock-like protein CspC [Pragia fontium]VEJ55417.1 Cold shock-like protein CspC [Pragia fontium]GKX61687.1 cold-shock protein [Pragia fontium]
MTLRMGMVKWFDRNHGVGLIAPLDGSSDVFVDRTSIANSTKLLTEGQNVEFSTYRTSRGPFATDVIAF